MNSWHWPIAAFALAASVLHAENTSATREEKGRLVGFAPLELSFSLSFSLSLLLAAMQRIGRLQWITAAVSRVRFDSVVDVVRLNKESKVRDVKKDKEEREYLLYSCQEQDIDFIKKAKKERLCLLP